MGNLAVLALRVVIALALIGSLLVQVALAPLLWIDLEDADALVRVALVLVVVLGVATLQVTAVCIWKLLTMVRRGTVFSPAAFRYVDIVIGAIATAAVLVFAVACLGAYSNRTSPGDEIAPGVVGLICGFALVVGGVALVVLVLRYLLAQAVDLRSELAEVI